MKIVHISHLYHPSQGGVQFFFKNISERLVKDYGDEVTVVTTNSWYGPERKIFKKIEPSEEVINGVKVIRFPYRRGHLALYGFVYKVLAKLGLERPEKMVMKSNGPYSKAMKQYLLKANADAICGSSANYYFMQLPLWRKCNFFYYGSIHLAEDKRQMELLPTQVKSMNASSLYLANTGYEKNRLAAMGVEEKRIFVLGTGVDMKPFATITDEQVSAFRHELAIPTDALIVGYVGRIEKTKNVALLVQAFEKVAATHSHVYLLLAGSANNYAEDLKATCARMEERVASRIRWQLNFNVDEKALIFNCMDMLVLPSHNESFGLVFLEAWSCKKPVIGAATGAIKDVIIHGADGLLMEINNEDSLVEKLTELLADKGLRQSLGEAGFEKVKAHFTWDIITAKLRKCYEKAESF